MILDVIERLMKVIIAPHASEKTARQEELNREVTFRVLKDANKKEIADAVELMFGRKVEKVTVLNQNGKRRSFGRHIGVKQDWKKAYVTLADGEDEIDFLGDM